MRPAVRCLAVMAFVLSCSGLPCLAGASQNGELQVVTEDWPPYDYLSASGEVAGINTALVRAVLKQAGLHATVQMYPWARAYFMAQNRPNTLIFSMARSKARENQFIWIGELMRRDDRFYRAQGHHSVTPTSIADIKAHYTVCVVNKDIAESDLQRLGFVQNRNYIATPSFGDCMKMVQTGAVSLLINAPLSLQWEARQHRGEVHTSFESVLPLDASAQEPFYLAASLNTPLDIIKRLREAFSMLQQSGQLDNIRHQTAEQDTLPPSAQ